MAVERLTALSSIEEITDYLKIDGYVSEKNNQFTNLTFLKKLRIIHGRKLSG